MWPYHKILIFCKTRKQLGKSSPQGKITVVLQYWDSVDFKIAKKILALHSVGECMPILIDTGENRNIAQELI